MLGNLEGYSGDGFNQRRAYIGNNNAINFANDKKTLEEKTKKDKQMLESKLQEEKRIKTDTINQMNNLMKNNNLLTYSTKQS